MLERLGVTDATNTHNAAIAQCVEGLVVPGGVGEAVPAIGGVREGGVAGKLSDPVVQSGELQVGDLIGAGHNHRIGAAQVAYRLTEHAPGQHMTEAPRLYCVDQHEIQITVRLAVLEAVVEQEDIDLRVFGQHTLSGNIAVRVGGNGDGRAQFILKDLGFVAADRGLGMIATQQDGGVCVASP